ncbi:predicted protein [Chaetoceros tenuissimus]|uniref:Uncharacterized protein n=1 Tax=Chaetoceros tenuissimus TaxID=426638 RepID=A0AAD3CSI9_9STRA|nr:predicted protein [Chaetoceros tenuissimus]
MSPLSLKGQRSFEIGNDQSATGNRQQTTDITTTYHHTTKKNFNPYLQFLILNNYFIQKSFEEEHPITPPSYKFNEV